jgi:hypothetical protein
VALCENSGASCWKWRIPDGKGGEWNVFMFRALKVVAPTYVDWGPIVWPRWTRLIICWHIRDSWGPTKLVASTVTELDDTLPHIMDIHWDSVWATHRLPVKVFTWKTVLGQGRTRLDSLIVIVKGGHSCCLCGSRVSCCQVISLAMCTLIQISMTPSDMGDACSLLSFHRSVISLCSYEIYGYD